MTEHPLILVSAVLTKFYPIYLQHLHYQKKSLTDERRLKRQHGMSIHYRNPHQQDVSAANERKNGIFGQSPDWGLMVGVIKKKKRHISTNMTLSLFFVHPQGFEPWTH